MERSGCGDTLNQVTQYTFGGSGIPSPDGQHMVRSVGHEIWVSNLDGSDDHMVAYPGMYPRWSPDGSTLVYNTGVDYYTENVYTVSAAGGDSHAVQVNRPGGPLNAGDITDSSPTWSPDGHNLAMIHNDFSDAVHPESNRSQVYVTSTTGDNRQLVYTAGIDKILLEVEWTPDSQELVFIEASRTNSAPTEVKVVGASGGPAVKLDVPDTVNVGGLRISQNWYVGYFTQGGVITFPILSPGDAVTHDEDAGFPLEFRSQGSVSAPPAGWPPAGIDVPGSGNPGPTPTPTPSPTPKCPKLQFVGVRGSGETQNDAGGYGATINDIRKTIEKKIPGTESQAIDYPAIAVGYGGKEYGSEYVKSISKGHDVLDKILTDFLTRCKTTYVVLAGYSQGAHVAGDEFSYLTKAERAHVGALILIGDPRFNPKQPKVDDGTYDPKLSGVYQLIIPEMRQIPAVSVPNVHSYCIAGDPICNYTAKALSKCAAYVAAGKPAKCPHVQYLSDWTQLSGLWAVKHIRGLPAL